MPPIPRIAFDRAANQTVQALCLKRSDPSTRYEQYSATVAALAGIGPKDELEGMMAAQLIAAHNAPMECYRRAMLGVHCNPLLQPAVMTNRPRVTLLADIRVPFLPNGFCPQNWSIRWLPWKG